MAEHMLKALLERLNAMQSEYADKAEELTCKHIAAEIFDVMKHYTFDRREILNLFGTQELSASDFQAIKELDYE